MKQSFLFAVVWGLLFAVPALFAGIGQVPVSSLESGSRFCSKVTEAAKEVFQQDTTSVTQRKASSALGNTHQ